MTKKKAKFTLLDYLLFRRDFSMYFEHPIEDCAEGIRGMTYEPTSFFDMRKQEVTVMPIDHNTVEFDIQRKRRSRMVFIISARARGMLIDNGDGTTSLHGVMRSGIWYVLILLFPGVASVALFIFLFGSDPIFAMYALVVFAIALAIIGGLLAKDRHHIRRDLVAAVERFGSDDLQPPRKRSSTAKNP